MTEKKKSKMDNVLTRIERVCYLMLGVLATMFAVVKNEILMATFCFAAAMWIACLEVVWPDKKNKRGN